MEKYVQGRCHLHVLRNDIDVHRGTQATKQACVVVSATLFIYCSGVEFRMQRYVTHTRTSSVLSLTMTLVHRLIPTIPGWTNRVIYDRYLLCPTSTSAHPMSRHNFDRAHSTKLFATKICMCPPGPNPTPFISFFVKEYEELRESRFTHCHAFQPNCVTIRVRLGGAGRA
jgi:hypothetical protein